VSENRETRMPLADGRPLTEAVTLQTYTLELVGPPDRISQDWRAPLARTRTVLSPHVLQETQENLTDLLPEGYSVRIKEWDDV
jgi:hypothetical protein